MGMLLRCLHLLLLIVPHKYIITMTSKNKDEKRVYNILVYGIEMKGLDRPKEDIKRRNFNQTFENFKTDRWFNEFDGVILFQGIFEEI